MADFLETSFEQLPLPAKRRVDAACARFESACREGRPQLESFLAADSTEERSVLLSELLQLDVEYRRRAGEQPRVSDYLKRFPDHEAVIRSVLPPAKAETDGGLADDGHTVRVFTAAKRPAQVPGYELLDELGRGGMGIVYKARHVALNRLVALKFILAGTNAPARHAERFRREAEVVARLRHPNIVQIYDIGEVDNQAFLALEYAEGGSLRERLAGQPMEPRAAAVLMEPLARAVQHAHRQGIIHRDIKPANILLAVGGDSVAAENRALPDRSGSGRFDLPEYVPPLSACTPKLTDFGLARMLDASASVTEQGVATGTPQYMAPEQAYGDPQAGQLIDVWALGVTLYELLTGHPPFRAASARETLRMIVDGDPVPPTQLQPSVPRDLETICLKCLEKEALNRYEGARELAQDLRRFLDGEPILARPVGPVERLRKWAKRKPLRAMLAAAVFTLATAGVTAATAGLVHGYRGWAEAKRGADDLQGQVHAADAAAARAQGERDAAEESRRKAELEAARLLLEQAGTQGRLGAPDRAAHDLMTGLRLSPADPSLGRVFRANLAGWLPYVHPLERIAPMPKDVRCVALGPEGVLYAGDARGLVHRFDSAGKPMEAWHQQEPIRFLAFSRGVKPRVLIGEPRRVVVRDAGGGEVGQTALHPRLITDAVFAADGRTLFTACEDNVVRRYRLEGPIVSPELPQTATPRRLAVSPDGGSLAVALGERDGSPGGVAVWRVAGKPEKACVLPHPAAVWAVAFHPDGRRLFSGCADGQAREWDVAEEAENGRPFDHGGEVVQVDVTPDGRTLLTASRDEVARLWEVPTRRPVGMFPGALTCTRLSGDGTRLVAALPGEARIHMTARPLSRLPGLTLREHPAEAPITQINIFDDGKRLLYVQPHADPARGLVWAREARPDATLQAPWPQQFREVTCMAVEGRVAAVASRQGDSSAVRLWDTATGQPLRPAWNVAGSVVSLAVSPGGREVAAGDEGSNVYRWDAATGEALPSLKLPKGAVTALAYQPKNKALAVGVTGPEEGRGEAGVWGLDPVGRLGEPIEHPAPVASLAFGASGDTLLIGGYRAHLWRLDTNKPMTPEVRRATVARFAGGEVLVGCADGHVHRFDADGKPKPVVTHPGGVLAVDLSPGGKVLLVAGREGTVRLWDVEGIPRPLGPPLMCNRPVVAARFLDDGKRCLSVAADGDVRVWPVPRGDDAGVDEWERRVLVWTGRKIDDAGALTPLPSENWAVRKKQLEAEPPAAGAAAWHDARARDARQDGDLFGERWHLDKLAALSPGDRSVYRRRAVVMARMGLYKEAKENLTSAGDTTVEPAWAAAACEAQGDRAAAKWFREAMSR